jgi:hypothetical protein
MPIATQIAALPRPGSKMESDRKRPAGAIDDTFVPPSKRQAVNGGSKSKDDSGDAKEEQWIEVSSTAFFDQHVFDGSHVLFPILGLTPIERMVLFLSVLEPQSLSRLP